MLAPGSRSGLSFEGRKCPHAPGAMHLEGALHLCPHRAGSHLREREARMSAVLQADVMVIGGGAAGLMAAGQAAAAGAETLLLERTARLGTKLRITGKGRCNLTNTAALDDFLAHFAFPDPHSPSRFFLRNAFARFFNEDLTAFFAGLGVPTVVERGGRVFPASNDAHQVAEALIRFARQQGARFRLRSRVAKLWLEGDRLRGVVLPGGERLAAGAVIVATGGASYPKTGSTGDGYRLAAQAGHTIRPIRPALVPLVLAGPEPRQMMGLSLRNVEVRLLLDGREFARDFGEMLFTHYGVSGPIILTLSGPAVTRLGRGRLEMSINLKPALSPEKLDARLRRDFDHFGRRSYRNLLKGLLPQKMIEVVIARSGISPDKPGHQITAGERARLRSLLHDFRLEIVGHRPLAEAIVTAGGVDTREV
ncbi:MAG TPA: aminoacetone oxidase family FAD-binding enzyme, partial [Anaerolineae bacterium]|nr:aminoacetone oxidase family FAD-binding enzyme [Anaerolineae bacterium]